MVREALLRGQARGWDATAVFREDARDWDWARALAQEVEVVFRPPSRAAVADVLSPAQTTVVQTHFSQYDLPAAIAVRGRPELRLVWHVHTSLPQHASGRFRSIVKYTLGRRLVDATVCVGPHLVDEVVRSGASRRHTMYLPNGIDTSRFQPAPADERTAARLALGFPSDRPVVLHYGWSWHVKGGDLFCAAIGELRRRGVQVTAVTVGADAQAETDARRFGIEDELVRLPLGQNIEQLLAAADVLALPSRAEGGNPPLTVLECLAAGVPVVASETPGQTLGNKLAAYRPVPLQPAAIAEGIETQLTTTDQARKAARAYIQAERSLKTWTDRVHAIYDAILSEDQPPG